MKNVVLSWQLSPVRDVYRSSLLLARRQRAPEYTRAEERADSIAI